MNAELDPKDEWLTTAYVQKLMRCSETKVRRIAKQQGIKTYKDENADLRYDPDAVDAYLLERDQGQAASSELSSTLKSVVESAKHAQAHAAALEVVADTTVPIGRGEDRTAGGIGRDLLAPGGRLVLVVPMLRALYGEIDRAIHHQRRYERADIESKLTKAGFAVEAVQPMNAIGIPGWWLNSVVLKRRAVPGIQARINDLLVPWLRVEQKLGIPVGMSMLVVGKRD